MDGIYSYEFRQWFAQFLIVVFLVGGLVTFAVGVGLVTWSAGTLRLFVSLDRWISTRRVFRPIEVPHDTTRMVGRYRRWLAIFFIAGAAYSLYGLITAYTRFGFIHLLYLENLRAGAAYWIADSVRWILIVGNLAAVVVGVMLGFFPHAIEKIEARGGRWFSDRQIVKGADTMKRPLDAWVVSHPHIAGWITTVAGLIIAGDFAVMLSTLR